MISKGICFYLQSCRAGQEHCLLIWFNTTNILCSPSEYTVLWLKGKTVTNEALSALGELQSEGGPDGYLQCRSHTRWDGCCGWGRNKMLVKESQLSPPGISVGAWPPAQPQADKGLPIFLNSPAFSSPPVLAKHVVSAWTKAEATLNPAKSEQVYQVHKDLWTWRSTLSH